jgi:UDP-N-acetylmuramoylalanine--D-glutamate ligase
VELSGKKVLVIGLKRTGAAVVRFVTERGGRVRVTDRQTQAQLATDLASLVDIPCEMRLGTEEESLLTDIDLVIPSPGVPQTAPLLRAAVQRGIPVWSEIELAFRFLSCPIVAVTGTNGKSTTTSLLGEFFRENGTRAFVGGNLGTPLLEAVAGNYDVAVAEVSSFQLEWIKQFHPRIGLWLNLTEDHLDRHGTLAAYSAAKRALFLHQTPAEWAVINREDPEVWRLAHGLPGRLFSFGWNPISHGAWVNAQEKTLIVKHEEAETQVSLDHLRLYGRHNWENVMAAVSAATLWGIPRAVIERVLASFTGLPHRLAWVATKNGVAYFDDSKGTNVGAVVQSLAGFDGPVILLAGGVDKGGDYGPLRAPLRSKVKKLILFGAARETMERALARVTDTTVVETLPEAVRAAAAIACYGDTVLLSPACASFDQFRNYAHRGEVFQACVEEV